MSDTLPGTDPATNSRFTLLADGRYSERLCDQMQLFYDPTTGEGRVMCNHHSYLQVGDTYLLLGSDWKVLEVNLLDRLAERYGAGLVDPITQMPLDQLSPAGVELFLKAFFDREHNRQAQEQAAIVAAAQAAAAQAQQLTDCQAAAAQAVDSPANGTQVDFTVTLSGQDAVFQDSSILAAGQAVTTRHWIFGDGLGSSLDASPSYRYEAAGAYAVILVLTLADGTSVRTTKPLTITT